MLNITCNIRTGQPSRKTANTVHSFVRNVLCEHNFFTGFYLRFGRRWASKKKTKIMCIEFGNSAAAQITE